MNDQVHQRGACPLQHLSVYQRYKLWPKLEHSTLHGRSSHCLAFRGVFQHFHERRLSDISGVFAVSLKLGTLSSVIRFPAEILNFCTTYVCNRFINVSISPPRSSSAGDICRPFFTHADVCTPCPLRSL